MMRGRLVHWLFTTSLVFFWACSDSGSPSPGDAGSGPDADASEVVPPDDGGGGKSGGDGGGQTVSCPAGATLVQYSLTRPDTLPTVGMLDLPGLHPATIIVPAGDGSSDSMRFDLCQDAGGLELHAIVLRGEAVSLASRYVLDASITSAVSNFVEIPEGRVFEIRVPRSAAVVEGLSEAITGDLRPLRIRLLGEMGLLVVGQAGFVAVARGNVGAASIEYTSLYVLIGGLAPGDVFAGLRCRFGEMFLETSFQLDTALFEIEACTFLGGGITTGHRIRRLAVEDSNSALEEVHRHRFEFTTESEVDGVLNYRWNHHNACDSFHLALGHADYAASSAPAAGCGPQVPNAPLRDVNEPTDSPVRYRIRYYGGDWRDGSIAGCSHYLGCD